MKNNKNRIRNNSLKLINKNNLINELTNYIKTDLTKSSFNYYDEVQRMNYTSDNTSGLEYFR